MTCRVCVCPCLTSLQFLDFSHVSENLFRRCTARFGHSATAGKKRFFLLLRACPSLRSLLAQIVTYRQEVPVSEELRAVVNAMSGERCAGDEQQHRQAKEIGALALQVSGEYGVEWLAYYCASDAV